MKIFLSQLNLSVGDIDKNKQKILSEIEKAKDSFADIIVFSEMSITGYPPEDLLFDKSFIKKSIDAINEIALLTKDDRLAILVGGIYLNNNDNRLYNSLYYIKGSEIKIISKFALPNYSVFDEKRYFTSARNDLEDNLIKLNDINILPLICEDIWNDNVIKNVINLNQKNKIDLIISANASPFYFGKLVSRIDRVKHLVDKIGCNIIYLNQIGGQDELVFDGNSFVINKNKNIIHKLKSFSEDSFVFDYDEFLQLKDLKNEYVEQDKYRYIYLALCLALRDYVTKNGFKKVILGLSGGLDSAITGIIAIDVLGAENVYFVSMPSIYTSKETMNDTYDFIKISGSKKENFMEIPITQLFDNLKDSLKPLFAGRKEDLTEENMQARLRGNILMSISNKFGYLVLSTSNKSEAAVGYATLYGDMCGGFSPIKDVYKTDIFALAKWRNNNFLKDYFLGLEGKVISDNIITKAPTAELRHDQKDQDSLPDYEILDAILSSMIEEKIPVIDIINQGKYDEELIIRIAKLVKNAEYKRKQSAIGPKISKVNFSKDRRYPVTNGFEMISK